MIEITIDQEHYQLAMFVWWMRGIDHFRPMQQENARIYVLPFHTPDMICC